MENLRLLLAILAGIAARLVIPILVTALAVYFLRRLDARWQKEGESAPVKVQKPACWQIKHCPPALSKSCIGRTSALPCWQARRAANGYLREECLSCTVFVKAPAPTHV